MHYETAKYDFIGRNKKATRNIFWHIYKRLISKHGLYSLKLDTLNVVYVILKLRH